MARRHPSAFTIIELLVVVSIIALLIGILLPAIGKARDQAKLTQSQGNLRNLGAAHETYGSEWNDRQFTLIVDNIARYGGNADEALSSFHQSLGGACNMDTNRGGCHPGVVLGWGDTPGGYISRDGYWGYWMVHTPNFSLVMPINFPGHGPIPYFGSFPLRQLRAVQPVRVGQVLRPGVLRAEGHGRGQLRRALPR